MKNIVFIGAGKMAEALLKGILGKSLFTRENITMADISAKRLKYLSETYGVGTNSNNITAISQAEAIILAVKPQNFKEVLVELHAVIKPTQLIISIAAGVKINMIDPRSNLKVARAMPNTPALVGAGATAVAFSNNINNKEKEFVMNFFNAVGITVEIPEDKINAVTGLSGSGPAFVFRLIDYFIKAGQKLGLTPELVKKLTFQTFLGAAKLAKDSDQSLEQLIENVTSPKGTTAAGREILENSEIEKVIINTIKKAKERADELSAG